MPMPMIARARPAAALVRSRAPERPAGPPAMRALRASPAWVWGVALAALLATAYLIVSPASADLAAATYRSRLFSLAGFVVWDNGWYAGHALPAYSLLAPALGAWLGVRVLLALTAVAASALFGVIAERALPTGSARAATLVFAFGFCAELPSGRVPYDLGVAVALAAVAAITAPAGGAGGRSLAVALAIVLALATSAASPVAGAFLALAGLTIALSARPDTGAGEGARLADRQGRGQVGGPPPSFRDAARGLAICVAALLPVLVLAAAFPEGGWEPFAAAAFWPELIAAVAFAALLPAGVLSEGARRALRIGASLYAVALVASFLAKTPVGGNAVRLGALLGAPLVAGALWGGDGATIGRRMVPARLTLLMLAPLLLYWQLATAIDDQIALAGDPSVQVSFYAPLRADLLRLADGRPIRVEVPLTGAHWESAYLPGGPISIARGWERQLDTRYGPLFYRRRLTAAAYARWLAANAISYVALPLARLDSAGKAEARLIRARPPYLREAWRSRRWRLYAVLGATPLAQPPARLLSIGIDSFTLIAPRGGSYEVRLHWTRYWALRSGRGCVSRAGDGFTEVRTPAAEKVEVGVQGALSRLLSEGPRCER